MARDAAFGAFFGDDRSTGKKLLIEALLLRPGGSIQLF